MKLTIFTWFDNLRTHLAPALGRLSDFCLGGSVKRRTTKWRPPRWVWLARRLITTNKYGENGIGDNALRQPKLFAPLHARHHQLQSIDFKGNSNSKKQSVQQSLLVFTVQQGLPPSRTTSRRPRRVVLVYRHHFTHWTSSTYSAHLCTDYWTSTNSWTNGCSSPRKKPGTSRRQGGEKQTSSHIDCYKSIAWIKQFIKAHSTMFSNRLPSPRRT